MIPNIMWRVTYVSSEDGRGSPTHVGYTDDWEAVERFLRIYQANLHVTVMVYKIINGKEEGHHKLHLD